MKLNTDPEWIRKKAEEENGCIVSVGGLASKQGEMMDAESRARILEKFRHDFYVRSDHQYSGVQIYEWLSATLEAALVAGGSFADGRCEEGDACYLRKGHEGPHEEILCGACGKVVSDAVTELKDALQPTCGRCNGSGRISPTIKCPYCEAGRIALLDEAYRPAPSEPAQPTFPKHCDDCRRDTECKCECRDCQPIEPTAEPASASGERHKPAPLEPIPDVPFPSWDQLWQDRPRWIRYANELERKVAELEKRASAPPASNVAIQRLIDSARAIAIEHHAMTCAGHFPAGDKQIVDSFETCEDSACQWVRDSAKEVEAALPGAADSAK